MYSAYLQDYIQSLATLADLNAEDITLLNDTMTCLVSVFGRAIDAETFPLEDLLRISIRLLLLDDGISQLPESTDLAHVHYLLGMGFEQTGALLARLRLDSIQEWAERPPLDNDHWYRLTLAFLHYLAGGYRVQALSLIRYIQSLTDNGIQGAFAIEYINFAQALGRLYSGENVQNSNNDFGYWDRLLFANQRPQDVVEQRIQRLAGRIQIRRTEVLSDLGLNDVVGWLRLRGIEGDNSVAFWTNYLDELRRRGITTFTNEQVGPGFTQWLHIDRGLVVILPTGSGKSIIGELMSALALSANRQIVWILPTRALVRQTQRELRRALEPLGVTVEELPTTEDYVPLFADSLPPTRHIAVTTPEKLEALIRANPTSVTHLGLVVFDEAQLLTKDQRGITAENVLFRLAQISPTCQFVFMTAFSDQQNALDDFLKRLKPSSTRYILSSNIRPTRRIYGVVTNERADSHMHPAIYLFPAGEQQEAGYTTHPVKISQKNRKLLKSESQSDLKIGCALAESTTLAGIRCILFVQQRDWTESRANAIANSRALQSFSPIPLPHQDLARLYTELGRESVIQQTASHRVAPHHAALTPLEQHIVEQWVSRGIVCTVIATPTLAQGVNLPFDLSIVSFVTRRDMKQNITTTLPPAEIQNMLGRAGRAGYVSDGICLIASATQKNKRPVRTLDTNRRHFFASDMSTTEHVGVRRLLQEAMSASVDRQEWVFELDGLEFSACQTLVSFTLGFIEQPFNAVHDIRSRLRQFPSLQNEDESVLDDAAFILATMANSLEILFDEDPIVKEVVKRTGMPVELVKRFVFQLRSEQRFYTLPPNEKLEWMDMTIHSVLTDLSHRHWFVKLSDNGKWSPQLLLACVSLWRNGATINEIELSLRAHWSLSSGQVGQFLNRYLPQFAQMWGTLAVCDQVMSEFQGLGEPDHVMRQSQTFVREGASNLVQLAWLRALGGIDRVLAHKLAAESRVVEGGNAIRKYAQQQLRLWHNNHSAIPRSLTDVHRAALLSVLDNLYGTS